jgi:anti-sigma regulatory factor (Ser/Thr protein kinase)
MSTTVADPAHEGHSLTHDGLLYRTPDDYAAGVLSFLHAGLAVGQPTFVAVPGPNLSLLRDSLNGASTDVQFEDMTMVGRNPARIIPAIRRFVDAHPRRRVQFVGEPIWPGRTPAEICEATRHEAMLNTAFAAAPVDILCPYDVSQLDPAAVADGWRTHPTVIDRGERRLSPHYDDPERLYAADDPILPAPPEDVHVLPVEPDDLYGVRQFVRHYANGIGLPSRRTQDLVLAVNEIAANTIVHTEDVGSLRIWREPQAVVCEIRDTGYIADPFAGRYSPDDGTDHGRGLWMANQLCDLVQIRSTEQGTTIRLHVGIPAS